MVKQTLHVSNYTHGNKIKQMSRLDHVLIPSPNIAHTHSMVPIFWGAMNVVFSLGQLETGLQMLVVFRITNAMCLASNLRGTE